MTVRSVSRRLLVSVPSILLLVVLAILVLIAWSRTGDEPVELTNPAEGIASITWLGTVGDDGRLAVEITYELDDTNRSVDIRLPRGARYLAVNGTPLGADIGRYASTVATGPVTVSYELPGRVTRYRDGAILQLASARDGYIDGDEALFPCPRCYIEGISYGNVEVHGELFVPGADAVRLWFLKLDSIRGEAGDDSIRFAGINEGVDDVLDGGRVAGRRGWRPADG